VAGVWKLPAQDFSAEEVKKPILFPCTTNGGFQQAKENIFLSLLINTLII
jgi:hypothetical protein